MAWREIIYQYDGSFEGLLCCVFESYTKKERPTAILRDGDRSASCCWVMPASVRSSRTRFFMVSLPFP